MLHTERYTCVKCGKQFTKTVGGIVMTPKEMELAMHPVCDKCKLNKVVDIFNPKK